MKQSICSRILCAVLAFVMLLGILPVVTPQAEAATAKAASTEYATPATQDELDTVARWFSGNNGSETTGTYYKIVDGIVYAWGNNNRWSLGLNQWKNPETQTYETISSQSDNVTVPTAIDKEAFNNENAEIIQSSLGCACVLTETVRDADGKYQSGNDLYVWGSPAGGIGVTVNSKYRQRKVDLSDIHSAGRTIEKINIVGAAIYLQDDAGKWYVVSQTLSSGCYVFLGSDPASYGGVYADYNENYCKKPYPIPDAILNQMDGKVIEMGGQHFIYSAYAITDKGKVYTMGLTNLGDEGRLRHGTGLNAASNATDRDHPVCINDYIPAFKNVKFVGSCAQDWDTAFLTDDGDVYFVNTWPAGKKTDAAGNITYVGVSGYSLDEFDESHKIFDHNVFQKRVIAMRCSVGIIMMLCDDNTVYAMGANYNKMITTDTGAGDWSETGVQYIYTPTQIFTDVSQSATITGIFPSNNSMVIVTKSGDMYFAGSNSSGGLGNGTTTNPTPGENTTIKSEDMPPSAPLTKNQMTFELEVTEDGKTCSYRPNGDGTYIRSVGGQDETANAKLNINAGQTFKLNVYFEDFGKIHGFVIPIRFDPRQIQVVNGSGVAYSDTQEINTPGAIGESVGIEQCFDSRDWAGGQLAVGSASGTYPKISNSDGWVSVMGYSTEKANPVIEGKVKMFSISFRAQKTVTDDGVKIDFATAQNTWDQVEAEKVNPDQTFINSLLGDGYDASCKQLSNTTFAAYWTVYNEAIAGVEIGNAANGYFAFDDVITPAFSTTYRKPSGAELELTYGDGTVMDETLSSASREDYPYQPGWQVNWGNTSVTYTISANVFSADGKNVPASFPTVEWKYTLMGITDNDTQQDAQGRSLSDYIQIVETKGTYIRFRINPSFTPKDDNEPKHFISFTATSTENPNVQVTHYVCLRKYSAPSTLVLRQENDSNEWATVINDTEFIYHSTVDTSQSDKRSKVFEVYFGVGVDGQPITENTEVVWSLLDSDGNAWSLSDPDVPLTYTVNANKVTLKPMNTTGDDYVILRVESLYDSNKYAQVKIKVQLYASELKFDPSIVRIAISTDTNTSTVDLSRYLQIDPVDVYATNLVYTITKTPTRKPSNDVADPDNVTWASISGSVLTAYEAATPVAGDDGAEEFVEVTAEDTLSGLKKTVYVAIMDLDCPIPLEQFVTTNAIGWRYDTVRVTDGLEMGDVLYFYTDYDSAVADTNNTSPFMKATVTDASMIPSFTFTVNNSVSQTSVMQGSGGYLAIKLGRVNSTTHELDVCRPVPVYYSPEPSEVYGYVHLHGKTRGSSANAGIRVDLSGLNFKETVLTDNQGYFRFTKYIAPGSYTMVISKANYLTRRIEKKSDGTGGLVITVGDGGKFCIATQANPLELVPGELTGDDVINIQDISYYVTNWVGITNTKLSNFSVYDFVDNYSIDMEDLQELLKRRDWVSSSYPAWNTPKQ